VLSGENINISMMQVGRKVRGQVGGESIMVLNVDESVSAAALLRLQNIDGIYGAQYVNLNAK
ncbi:MAG: phosphoglycerate dehydrogenase, partial [Acidobacteriota bacterium]